MKIIGPPSASKETVRKNLVALGPGYERFRDEMFEPLWSAGEHYVIDGVGMVAQAAKETAWGKYTGRMKPWHKNTCGLKKDEEAVKAIKVMLNTTDGNHTLCHQEFASYWVGAEAHAQHLRAYTGIRVVDRIYDPRYDEAADSGVRANHWYELTTWSEDPKYGYAVEEIMRRLSVTA